MGLFKHQGFRKRIQAEPSHRGEIAGLAPKPGARPKSKKALASFKGPGNVLSQDVDSDEATFGKRANSKRALDVRRAAAIRRERQEKIRKGELPDMAEEIARARGEWDEDDEDAEPESVLDSDDIDEPRTRRKQPKASSSKSTPAKSTPKASSSKRKRRAPSSSVDSSDEESPPPPRKKAAAKSSPGKKLLPAFAAYIPGGADEYLRRKQAEASDSSDESEPAPKKRKKKRVEEERPGKTPRDQLITKPFSPPRKTSKTKAKKAAPKRQPKKAVTSIFHQPWTCPVCEYLVRQ